MRLPSYRPKSYLHALTAATEVPKVNKKLRERLRLNKELEMSNRLSDGIARIFLTNDDAKFVNRPIPKPIVRAGEGAFNVAPEPSMYLAARSLGQGPIAQMISNSLEVERKSVSDIDWSKVPEKSIPAIRHRLRQQRLAARHQKDALSYVDSEFLDKCGMRALQDTFDALERAIEVPERDVKQVEAYFAAKLPARTLSGRPLSLTGPAAIFIRAFRALVVSSNADARGLYDGLPELPVVEGIEARDVDSAITAALTAHPKLKPEAWEAVEAEGFLEDIIGGAIKSGVSEGVVVEPGPVAMEAVGQLTGAINKAVDMAASAKDYVKDFLGSLKDHLGAVSISGIVLTGVGLLIAMGAKWRFSAFIRTIIHALVGAAGLSAAVAGAYMTLLSVIAPGAPEESTRISPEGGVADCVSAAVTILTYGPFPGFVSKAGKDLHASLSGLPRLRAGIDLTVETFFTWFIAIRNAICDIIAKPDWKFSSVRHPKLQSMLAETRFGLKSVQDGTLGPGRITYNSSMQLLKQYEAEMAKVDIRDPERSIFQGGLLELKKLVACMMKGVNANRAAVAPPWFNFHGNSHVGKSTVFNTLKYQAAIMAADDDQVEKVAADPENYVYDASVGLKHFDGASSHQLVLSVDDLGVVRDTTANPADFLQFLVNFLSPAACRPPMADLSEKGIVAGWKFVLTNTNIAAFDGSVIKSLATPEALRNRITRNYRTVPKQEYSIDEVAEPSDRVLDKVKAAGVGEEDEYSMEVYEFILTDPRTGRTLGDHEPYSFEEVVGHMEVALDDWRRDAARSIQTQKAGVRAALARRQARAEAKAAEVHPRKALSSHKSLECIEEDPDEEYSDSDCEPTCYEVPKKRQTFDVLRKLWRVSRTMLYDVDGVWHKMRHRCARAYQRLVARINLPPVLTGLLATGALAGIGAAIYFLAPMAKDLISKLLRAVGFTEAEASAEGETSHDPRLKKRKDARARKTRARTARKRPETVVLEGEGTGEPVGRETVILLNKFKKNTILLKLYSAGEVTVLGHAYSPGGMTWFFPRHYLSTIALCSPDSRVLWKQVNVSGIEKEISVTEFENYTVAAGANDGRPLDFAVATFPVGSFPAFASLASHHLTSEQLDSYAVSSDHHVGCMVAPDADIWDGSGKLDATQQWPSMTLDFELNRPEDRSKARNYKVPPVLNPDGTVDEGYPVHYLMRRSVSYAVKSRPGMCGLPVLFVRGSRVFFAGFHVAGNKSTIGVSLPVCRKDALRLMKRSPRMLEMPVEAELVSESADAAPPMFDSNIRGHALRLHTPTISQLNKSPLYGCMGPHPDQPANLADDLGLTLKKVTQKTVMWPQALLKEVEYLRANELAKDHTVYEPLLTTAQAVSGEFDGSVLNPMAANKAAGFPSRLYAVRQNKLDWIEDGRAKLRLINEIAALERDILAGEAPEMVFTPFPKDELRAAGKTVRVVYVADLKLNVLLRKYFGQVLNKLQKHKITNGSALGINVYSSDWGACLDRASLGEGGCVDGDIKSMDLSMHGTVIVSALRCWSLLYPKATAEETAIREYLMSVVSCPTILVNTEGKSWLVSLWRGLMSGLVATTNINIYANHLYYTVAAAKYLYPDWEPASHCYGMINLAHAYDQVIMLAYGDDSKPSFRAPLAGMSTGDIASALALMGVKFTNADKSDPIANPQLPGDPKIGDFLKRSFRVDEYGTVLAPISLDSIRKSIYWMRSPKPTETLHGAIDAAYKELALHGRAVFERYAPCITKAVAESREITMFPLLAEYDLAFRDVSGLEYSA